VPHRDQASSTTGLTVGRANIHSYARNYYDNDKPETAPEEVDRRRRASRYRASSRLCTRGTHRCRGGTGRRAGSSISRTRTTCLVWRTGIEASGKPEDPHIKSHRGARGSRSNASQFHNGEDRHRSVQYDFSKVDFGQREFFNKPPPLPDDYDILNAARAS
jgi:hypothetical protein